MNRGILAGSLVSRSWAPTPIYKSTDTGRSATATLADDPHLLSAIGGNQTWVYEFELYVTGTSNTPDINLNVTSPAGSSGWASVVGLWSSATSNVSSYRVGTGAFNSVGSDVAVINGNVMVRVVAYVANGVTAGNVVLQWAQAVSDPSTVTLKAGSYLKPRRLA